MAALVIQATFFGISMFVSILLCRQMRCIFTQSRKPYPDVRRRRLFYFYSASMLLAVGSVFQVEEVATEAK